ncbi:MAG: hypothetical protein WB698_04580 [Solirubrobacteraceae bacterium]
MSGDAGPSSGEVAVQRAAARYATQLGGRLLASYALGSLAHGGFSEAVSDVDLGLILSDPPCPDDAERIREIADRADVAAEPLDPRLSVFWGTPSTLRGEREGGRFPALDRLDLIEHGRLIAGEDEVRRGLPHPSPAELLVTGARFALQRLAGFALSADDQRRSDDDGPASEKIEELHSPELLIAAGLRRVTKTVLFPVRFLFTAASGRVATNDDAVDAYLADREAPSRALVAAARAWRVGSSAWDEQAMRLLSLELVPLYLHYMDDHVARLGSLGEAELMRCFEVWRGRLSGPR